MSRKIDAQDVHAYIDSLHKPAGDKLPEWPERESFDMGLYAEERHYYAELSEAALARMEALVKYAEHTGAWCSQGMGHACTCGLSELLAACERRKS